MEEELSSSKTNPKIASCFHSGPLDYLGRFTDPKLQEEYILSCLDQKSKFSFFLLTILVIGWSIVETIAQTWSTTNNNLPLSNNLVCGISILCCSFLAILCCIFFSIYSAKSSPSKEYHKLQSYLQVCFIILINVIYIVKLYAFTSIPVCIANEIMLERKMQNVLQSANVPQNITNLVEGALSPLMCPLSSSFSSVSGVFRALESVTPVLLMAIVYEPRLYIIIICFIPLGALTVYEIYLASYSVAPILITLFLLAVLLFELHYQRVQSFLNNNKLQEILQENERNADAMHALEMRHMIGNVAHDLKTPLASFATGLDLIKDIVHTLQKRFDPDYVANEAIGECISSLNACLSSIRNTNAFMLMTINRCIDYTKASKGMKLVPKYETVDLREALQFPIECMRNIQERIEINLEAIPEEICGHIITDKQWLQENLLCLLSNAVKYSTNGNVSVAVLLKQELQFVDHDSFDSAAWLRDQRVPESAIESFRSRDQSYYLRFEVEDSGIGIPVEVRHTLFNSFKQAQRLAGGTGLGLFSLAKRIEALKGFYGVEGRTDHEQGSKFWFTIPYRPDTYTMNANTLSSQSREITGTISLCPSSSADELEHLKPLEVLIVDDSPPILKMSSMMLKRQGHQIWTAENGEIALKRIEEKWKESGRGFDLVLIDLQMPVMDGLEATRRLRKIESEGRDWMVASNLNQSPVHQIIFGVSANSDYETMKEAFDAGVDDFLGKPFSIDLFNKSVQRFSSSHVLSCIE